MILAVKVENACEHPTRVERQEPSCRKNPSGWEGYLPDSTT